MEKVMNELRRLGYSVSPVSPEQLGFRTIVIQDFQILYDSNLSPEELKHGLLHELAHIQALHIVPADIQQEAMQEIIADSAASEAQDKKSSYAIFWKSIWNGDVEELNQTISELANYLRQFVKLISL